MIAFKPDGGNMTFGRRRARMRFMRATFVGYQPRFGDVRSAKPTLNNFCSARHLQALTSTATYAL